MRSRHYFGLEAVLLWLLLPLICVQKADLQQASLTENPSYYYVGCYTARTDLLKESVYAKAPQTCIEICEHQSYRYAVLFVEKCFCSNDLRSEERQDEMLCNSRCVANRSQYCGGVGMHSYYSTMWAKEPALSHLQVVNATENSLTVTWRAVEPLKMYIAGAETAPAQQITSFLIKSHVVQTYSSLPFYPQPQFVVQSTETRFEMTDLHPATEYNVSVAAMCGQTVCGSASLLATTVVGIPAPPPQQPRVVKSTDATITIEIAPIKNNNGPVTKVLIIVERVDNSLIQPFDTELLDSWQKAQETGVPYYIAGELDYQRPEDNVTRKFVVGDGKRYGQYTNPLIEDAKDAHIHISLGVVSELNGVVRTLYTRSTHDQHAITLDNFTYATFDSGRESIIALTVTCVIFGTCLVLSLITYFYLRYKTYQTRSNRQRNGHEMTLQQPIIERENNGFALEQEPPPAVNFKEQLEELLGSLEPHRRLPRNALRMNVNDVLADGRYGEVISGKLLPNSSSENIKDCQLHVLSLDDLSSNDQAHLLQDFRNLTRLQRHDHILDFYGVSASVDWFYLVFEQQTVSLKRRLIESRRVPNSAPVQRITSLSEQIVLQWIYEMANALDYLNQCKVEHRQLCSHNIFITSESQLKISIFGPVPYIHNQKKVDLSRWLAPEVLRYQHYSTKSVIWSFACVAWECCTLGGTLYANITSSQLLLDAIKSGSRPARPSYVYHDLYQLLLNCWQLEPSERPSCEDISYNIRQLMALSRYALCFDRQPETQGSNVLDTLPFYLPMLEMSN